MHLLLVSAHYPPDRASGARRPWELVGAFRRDGAEVTVLNFGVLPGQSVGQHGERVLTLARPPAAAREERRLLDGDSADSQDSPSHSVKRLRQLARRAMPGIARQWGAWHLYPDVFREGISTLTAAAADVPFDLVYSTAPPISVHLAAYAIAAKSGVPWVAEFRDPWMDYGTGQPVFSGTLRSCRETRDRKAVVRSPTAVVGVSEGIATWLQQEGAARVCVSRNGIPDRLLGEYHDHPIDFTTIGYFGEFYHARTPVPLFDAVALIQRRIGRDSPLALRLVGDVTRFGEISVTEMLAARGLSERAHVSGRVPHTKAIEMMRSSGVLWMLAQNQPRQVPNKLYEYLAAGRPILAWVDDEGESARILRDVGGHFLVTEHHTPDEITSIVAAALDAAPSWTPPHPERLKAYASSSQLAKVVELISAVVAEERGI